MNANNNYRTMRNFIAGILVISYTVILIFLLIADTVMYITKEEIPALFMDLTKIMLGAFVGMFSTVGAFYFGEPKTNVSRETLRMILHEMEERERTPEEDA